MWLTKTFYRQWIAVHVVLYCVLAMSREKYVVSDDLQDGFATQMSQLIANLESLGSWYDITSIQLGALHLARFLSVYPFYWMSYEGYHHFFQYLLILFALAPVLLASFQGRCHALQVFVIYMPFFLSFRAILVVCAISYLFVLLFGDRKSHSLLLLSAAWANLSSGSAIGWLLIALLNSNQLFRRYRAAWMIAVCLMALGIYASVCHKMIYFDDLRSVQTTSVYAMIRQCTLAESYRNGQLARLFVYAVMLMAGVGVVVRLWLERHTKKNFTLFYLVAIPGFLVEGLSVIGFVIPVFWFYAGVRPALKTERNGDVNSGGELSMGGELNASGAR